MSFEVRMKKVVIIVAQEGNEPSISFDQESGSCVFVGRAQRVHEALLTDEEIETWMNQV